MKVWKDRSGKWIDAKEFSTRFKSGIEKVSSLDKVKMQILFTYIVLAGILIGIISVIYGKMWWLLIILIGSFGLTCISMLGIYQQYFAYKKIDDLLNQATPVSNGPKDTSSAVAGNEEPDSTTEIKEVIF